MNLTFNSYDEFRLVKKINHGLGSATQNEEYGRRLFSFSFASCIGFCFQDYTIA